MQDSSNPIDKKKAEHAAVLHEFMVMLSVCHTVIPEKIDNSIIYHAASPGKSHLPKYSCWHNNIMCIYIAYFTFSFFQMKER